MRREGKERRRWARRAFCSLRLEDDFRSENYRDLDLCFQSSYSCFDLCISHVFSSPGRRRNHCGIVRAHFTSLPPFLFFLLTLTFPFELTSLVLAPLLPLCLRPPSSKPPRSVRELRHPSLITNDRPPSTAPPSSTPFPPRPLRLSTLSNMDLAILEPPRI